MDLVITDPLLEQFSDFVAGRMGLYFPPERWGDLEQAIGRAAQNLGCTSARACIQQLLTQPPSQREIEVLASYLTVGETYFFRDKASFEWLEHHLLPELIERRRASGKRLRIWSAGCSTGEEPYSIAILLAKLIPDLEAWNITILGTDINPHALQKAAHGIYTHWSFRDVPPGITARFFTRAGDDRFALAPRVQALVTFAHLNLVADVYPWVGNNTNAMDLILCRHVLMYFKPAHSRPLLERLSASLIDGGWLFVSAVETPHVTLPNLSLVNFPGGVVYRKERIPKGTRAAANERTPARSESQIVAAPRHVGQRERQRVDRSASVRPTSEISPDAGPELRAEARALYEQGHYAEAATKISEWLTHHPTDADAMTLLARAYANEGRLREAREWCEKASTMDKLDPGKCYLLATILQEQGETPAAVKALRRALYLDHDYALAHFALGNLARKQGNPTHFARCFRNALSILEGYPKEHVLPESEGITAGRLAEVIRSTLASEPGQ